MLENAEAVIESVIAAKPAAAKGNYLVNGAIAATMSPGIKVDISAYRK